MPVGQFIFMFFLHADIAWGKKSLKERWNESLCRPVSIEVLYSIGTVQYNKLLSRFKNYEKMVSHGLVTGIEMLTKLNLKS